MLPLVCAALTNLRIGDVGTEHPPIVSLSGSENPT
jgi:hypothetical protein